MESSSVVIAGGGISGAAIAFFLSKRGCNDVLLVERSRLGSGSTGAAAGGIRAQFSTEVNIRCSLLSLPFWEHFERETGHPHTIKRSGYLLLATTPEEGAALAAAVALQNRLSVPSRILNPPEIGSVVPALSLDGLECAAYNTQDGVGSPYDALQGYIGAAKRAGVRVIEGTSLASIEINRGRVVGVRLTNGERVATAVVVNAAGPWSGELATLAGLDVPVEPYRREIYVSEPFPELPPGPLVIDLHTNWYYRHEGERILMAGIADRFPSWNTTLDWSRLPEVASVATKRLPLLSHAAFTSGWAGSYDISPDNHGILGSFPELEGFICACGFSGHGYMHSPATGILVAEMILDGKARSVDVSSLAPTRFRDHQPVMERLSSHGELRGNP
jgi:sarcosine oxidase subunit beta